MPDSPVLGGELLRLVTAGMYDNPLVLYREYLQNSADAIASLRSGTGSVRITIDALRSRITILDDGPGLTPEKAVECLIDLGRSPKDPSIDRGFRGIGRLSALAFAEQLDFTTRTRASDPPTRVSWNASALRGLDLAKVDARTAIQESSTTTQISSGEWPERFFQVTIDRVRRHAASTLLNEDAVRNYIGEVCPVPMSTRFPLAEKVREFLTRHTDHFVLDIHVNDSQQPIKRPFNETIPLTEQFSAPYETLETSIIPRPDTDEPAAILWLAHTPYSGSISRRLGIRGLRARVGNLQIGTDRIFEHLFLEPRFNGWCVGEVHILDRRIVPNGRRDYFEPGPHLRNLENHIGAVAHQISSRCRRASSQRNKLRNINAAIQRLEAARDLVRSGLLLPADAGAVVERERIRIPAIRETIALVQAGERDAICEESMLCDHQFDELSVDPNPALRTVPPASLGTVQTAFGTIARSLPPDSALELIEAILEQLCHGHTSDHAMP
ncbi:MAG: HSP90 family molecular chaperone-like protein [Acidobacteriia bacterium]|nr:HSP90 family molecular chaperone-like protein [Terriglobia bacterium]